MRQDQARTDLDGSLDVDRVLGDQERSPEPEDKPRASECDTQNDRRMEARVLDQPWHEHQRKPAR